MKTRLVLWCALACIHIGCVVETYPVDEGAGGTGGIAGTSGVGGDAGSSGQPGTGGSSGAGGSAGIGGTSGTGGGIAEGCLDFTQGFTDARDSVEVDGATVTIDERVTYGQSSSQRGDEFSIEDAPSFMRNGKWSVTITPDFSSAEAEAREGMQELIGVSLVDSPQWYTIIGFAPTVDGGYWFNELQLGAARLCLVLVHDWYCSVSLHGDVDTQWDANESVEIIVDSVNAIVTFKGKTLSLAYHNDVLAPWSMPDGPMYIGALKGEPNRYAHSQFTGTIGPICEIP
ncbi:MAG: hypothetical protein R3A47_05610 [Polyangiales bacterium]